MFSGPAQCYDIRHRLAGHVTKDVSHRNIDNMDKIKRARRVTRYNLA
jgi:hypothetical protein